MTENKPIKVFKAGGVRAAIWENHIEKEGRSIATHSIQIDRTYKQGDEFKRTSQFNVQDLCKVQLVAAKAYELLSLQSSGEDGKEKK